MINENFFSEYNSDMFYVIGLLYSDGYLVKPKRGKKYVAIKLIDKDILTDINVRMGNNSEPKKVGVTSAGNKLYKISFINSKLIEDLERIGLHQRKTFTIKFPQIPNEYVKDFIRGYFDGDGCIHISKRKNRVNSYVKSFSILGTNDVLNGISKNLPCKSYVSKYKKIFRLTVNKGDDIQMIYDYLYAGDNLLFLNRKKEHFEYTINTVLDSKINQSKYTKKEQLPRLTKNEFIERARTIHGDRYDYSLVDFKNVKTKIKILCGKHDIFEQTPLKHLIGHNCPKCSGSFMNTQYFIEKSKILHDGKYDYSLVKYVNNKTNVIIICPEHGEFKQLPSNHLLGRGCLKCSVKRKKEIKEQKFKDKLNQNNN